MKRTDGPSAFRDLRAWLKSASESDCDRIAKYVCDQAMSGHFGFFKLLIDLVDGKLRQTAEVELTCETDCVLILIDEERTDNVAKAA